jgi:cell division protein ZapA (FtsZ GTPase activity inhibitor)
MEEVKKTIAINGRQYPLIVSDEESSWIETIEKEINERINSLKTQYHHLDTLDCLTLTLIDKSLQQKVADQKNSLQSKETLNLLKEIHTILQD